MQPTSFGEVFREIRLKSNLSQIDVGRKLETSQAWVSDLENNRGICNQKLIEKALRVLPLSRADKTALNNAWRNSVGKRAVIRGLLNDASRLSMDQLNKLAELAHQEVETPGVLDRSSAVSAE